MREQILDGIKKFNESGGLSITGTHVGAMPYDKGDDNDGEIKLNFVYEVMLKGEVDGKERTIVAHGYSNHDLTKSGEAAEDARNRALINALSEWNV